VDHCCFACTELKGISGLHLSKACLSANPQNRIKPIKPLSFLRDCKKTKDGTSQYRAVGDGTSEVAIRA
jgi:hypothetical protein